MKKVQLEIKSIQYSNSQSGAYVIILDDKTKTKRLPIVIGGFEARAIAFKLEKISPSRPLTHDIFKNLADSFSIKLLEVLIYKFQEGIFYSKLIFEENNVVKEIDSRTSDGIALALRFNSNIYIYEDILEQAGIDLNESSDTEDISNDTESIEKENEYESYSVHELNELLNLAIADEDFEKASKLRDEIKQREANK
ncbi:MAG: bifunctional nuclease domain-containing protein [Hyphomicrobiales bacterium]